MDRLRECYRRAATGSGGVVTLVGEPGIGKTWLAHELGQYALEQGSTVLWGRTPETPGAPPYWPWVQVVNQFLAENPGAALELSPEARLQLGRIVPALGNAADVGPTPQATPESLRFRLFDAYLTMLRAMVPKEVGAPLVVVLDDLHSADLPSLLLLQYVSHELSGNDILVLGTYRDTDVTRQSALTEVLAELRRGVGFERIVLRGLSGDEVRTFVHDRLGAEPSPLDLIQICETTDGNAFFVEEVVRLMAEDGALGVEGAGVRGIPEGVKDALGRRLNRLSAETNDVLRIAALLGRDFGFRDIETVSGLAESRLLECLEQATAGGFLVELAEAGNYRFVHALMRETLVAELSTTRRAILQGQLAEALEEHWGSESEAQAGRLAHHFGEATTLSPRFATKARRYALLAARQAEGQYAWSEAWGWYEAAVDGEDHQEADVLAALAYCCALAVGASDPRAPAALVRAVDAFRVEGRWTAFAWAVARTPNFAGFWQGMRELVEEAIEHVPEASDELMLLLKVKLFWEAYWLCQSEEVERVEDELLKIVERSDLPECVALRSLVRFFKLDRAGRREEAVDLAFEAGAEYERLGRLDDAGFLLNNCVGLTLQLGGVSRAAEYLQRASAFNTKYDYTTGRGFERLYGNPIALLRWAAGGLPHGGGPGLVTSERGSRLDEVRSDIFEGRTALAPSLIPKHRLIGHARRARRTFRTDGSAAMGDLLSWAELWRAGVARLDMQNRVTGFTYVTPCLVALGEDFLCREVYDEVRHWKNWCGPWSGIGVDVCRGELALRLGLVDEAEEAFRDGVAWAEQEDCPIEVGLSLEGLGKVADRRRDRALTLQYFDLAAAIFEKRGAQLCLDELNKRRAPVARGDVAPSVLPGGLSVREAEVLRLLAEGKTNGEIANSLVLSYHTVSRHVSNIFDKIHVSNRAEAMRWAIRHGLAE